MFYNKQNGHAQKLRVCYGVDIQHGELMVVRAERSRGRIIQSTIPASDAAFLEAIRKGAACAGSLSTKESFTRWLEAPFAPGHKTMKVLPTLLDVELPFPLEDCVYCFSDIQRAGATRTRALAVVARAQDIRKRIAEFNAKGIDPVSLDQEGLALWDQALREAPVSASESGLLRIVLHSSADHTSVVIGRGGEFINAHGLRSVDAGQIGRILMSHQAPGSAQVCWIWTGPSAADGQSLTALRDQLLKEWPGVSTIPDEPASFLPRALATRALATVSNACNLRTGDLTHPQIIMRRRRTVRRAALGLLAASLLLCVADLAVVTAVNHESARLDYQFRALGSELAGYDIGDAKGEQGLQKVREKVAKRAELTAPFLAAFRQPLSEIAASIAQIGKKSSLSYETLSLATDKASISGTAPDWNACNDLMKYLLKTGYDVKLDRKQPENGERVPFTIMPVATAEKGVAR